MISAPPPPDEQERIQLLHALNLLDTPPEPVFDRITRLVSHLLDVPMALISLVDSNRQWFKSKVGITAAETPRDIAFCAHAILEAKPLLIPDAKLDERFSDNPLVTGDLKVRFYAGIPIRTAGGLAMGTLCAIDNKPRILSPAQLEALSDLADIVTKEIQVRETVALSRNQLVHSQQLLQASEVRFRSVFEKASVGIALVSPDGRWISVNNTLCEIVGYSAEELTRRTFQDITHPEDLNRDLALLKRLIAGEIDQYQIEKRYLRKDGSAIWISLNVSKKETDDGRVDYFISVIKDIQARKEAEEALATLHHELEERVQERTREVSKREAELRLVIENASDAYVSIDEEGKVLSWNKKAHETFGWSANEATGRILDELIIPEPLREAHRTGMKKFLDTRQSEVIDQRIEFPAVRRDGSELLVEIRIRALDLDGHVIFSAFLNDISERKRAEIQREREARYDALTGLLNRRGLLEEFPRAIARSARAQRSIGVLFLDLDGFKAVNDTLGHDAGDALLKEVAARLVSSARQVDTVARLAGDEFTIILEGLTAGTDEVQRFAERIISEVSRPVTIGSEQAQAGVSIGATILESNEAQDGTALLKRADEAMYQAKRAGKGRVVII